MPSSRFIVPAPDSDACLKYSDIQAADMANIGIKTLYELLFMHEYIGQPKTALSCLISNYYYRVAYIAGLFCDLHYSLRLGRNTINNIVSREEPSLTLIMASSYIKSCFR